MTVNVSSNFKSRILGRESFADIFNGGRILLFSGPQPSSADNPQTGTFLGHVTERGNAWTPGGSAGGLNFVQSGVWAAHDPSQMWDLTVAAAGTASWFRLVGRLADDGNLSYAAPRIDGSVGSGGAVDMTLPTTALTMGYTTTLQQFLFTLPAVL